MPPNKRGRKRRAAVQAKEPGAYHHGDLRRALLDAALVLIERDGPTGLTLRGAARLAGVSQTAPYRHFSDKEGLLASVAEQGFTKMAVWMREYLRPGSDPLESLVGLGVGYVSFAAAHPAHFRVMFGPQVSQRSAYPSLEASARGAFSILEDAVVRAQRSGALRPGDPRELALCAWALVHGLSLLLADGQAITAGWGRWKPDELASMVGHRLLEGLARPGTVLTY